MKESHSEGLASHADPESCAVEGNRGGEALTGARTGPVLSRENAAPSTRRALLGADALADGGRPHGARRHRESCADPTRSETRCMYGTLVLGSRESLWLPLRSPRGGRVGTSKDERR